MLIILVSVSGVGRLAVALAVRRRVEIVMAGREVGLVVVMLAGREWIRSTALVGRMIASGHDACKRIAKLKDRISFSV